MKRILIFGMTENPGGVEKFLINYYRYIHKDQIQFDFLCNTLQKVAYEDELLSMGARTFHISPRKRNPITFRHELDKLFQEHAQEWSGIWVNVCSLANIDYLKKAKKYGIERRIIHSHNSSNMDGVLRGLLHKWNKRKISGYATDFWACSKDAANWFYPKVLLRQTIIIHNAIDIEQMRFDPAGRKRIRQQYGWENKYVIGHVGRLHFQKNQSFLIDVFEAYYSKDTESVLVFVGQGEDEKELKENVASKHLTDAVFFPGIQSDIPAWLSSFDLFVFPSVFEGTSISLLEAVANGVPILASDSAVLPEMRNDDCLECAGLNEGIGVWCERIEKMRTRMRGSHEEIKRKLISQGYDIRQEAGNLEKVLLNGVSMYRGKTE